MPLTDDRKPRNRWRRDKYRQSVGKPLLTHKQMRRRFIRGLVRHQYLEQCATIRRVENALRSASVSWRDLEVAVNSQVAGQWSRLAEVVIDTDRAHRGPIDVAGKQDRSEDQMDVEGSAS